MAFAELIPHYHEGEHLLIFVLGKDHKTRHYVLLIDLKLTLLQTVSKISFVFNLVVVSRLDVSSVGFVH